jgi:hypothetical protein
MVVGVAGCIGDGGCFLTAPLCCQQSNTGAMSWVHWQKRHDWSKVLGKLIVPRSLVAVHRGMPATHERPLGSVKATLFRSMTQAAGVARTIMDWVGRTGKRKATRCRMDR